MKIKILIIVLMILSVSLDAQIKDGIYRRLPRVMFMPDGVELLYIKKDSVKYCYHNLSYTDSTVGRYLLHGKYLDIKWAKQPRNNNQLDFYRSVTLPKPDKIKIIVRDKSNKPIAYEAKVLFSGSLRERFTNTSGILSVKRNEFSKSVNISLIGYQSMKFDCDTTNLLDVDSIVVRLSDWGLRYITQPERKYLIHDINANGFELKEGNEFVQYLNVEFIRKLEDVRLVKQQFTKEEYDNILKF